MIGATTSLFGVVRLLALVGAGVAGAMLLRAQESPSRHVAQGPDAIRVRVDRVNVGVIVTDSRGAFVEGLRREDFHVFDDGVEQPITDFASIAEPAQVLILVEAGPAVYFLESSHLQAARALLDGLAAGDRIAVVKYDASPQALLDFTPDKQAAAAALVNVRYFVGFGSLNLSKSLGTVLDWLAKSEGKKTIVLLSTGIDTSPPNDIEKTLARLKTSDVRLLAISLSGTLRAPAPNPKAKNKIPTDKAAMTEQGFADADHLLKLMTEATGGRVYFPNSARDFADAYAQIAQLVRHEYSLAFAPTSLDNLVHTLDVKVKDPTYRVDHRQTYLASAP